MDIGDLTSTFNNPGYRDLFNISSLPVDDPATTLDTQPASVPVEVLEAPVKTAEDIAAEVVVQASTQLSTPKSRQFSLQSSDPDFGHLPRKPRPGARNRSVCGHRAKCRRQGLSPSADDLSDAEVLPLVPPNKKKKATNKLKSIIEVSLIK